MPDQQEQPGGPTIDAVRLAHAWSLLDGYVAEGAVPGVAAVVACDDRVVGDYYTGIADPTQGQPVCADTIFALASLTKPVTAAAVLVLVERGLCSLDESITRFVPETDAIAGSTQITVRHLLTHTSGLPGFTSDDRNLRAVQAPLSAFFDAALRCSVGFTPGTALRYSNPGIHLLAMLIARVSGRGYHEAVADLVLQPLGMSNSFLPVEESQWPRVAHVADPSWPGTPHEQFNSPYHRTLGLPWGGLYATARDVSRFLTYFLTAWSAHTGARPATVNGPLSPATRRMMTTAQVSVPPAPAHPDDDVAAQQWPIIEWGLGWEIKGARSDFLAGDLTSPLTFGHSGASGTMMWADPTSGLSCVMLANRASATGWGTRPPRRVRFSNAVAASLT